MTESELGTEPISTLRAAREARGWTQEYVARAMGLSREMISRFESGSREPSNAQAFALASLFNVRVGEVERWYTNAAPAATPETGEAAS